MRRIKVTMPFYEIRVSLTGKCNHKCIYCGPFSDGKVDKGYGELSLDQIKELSPSLKELGLHVQLTGGEPTLRKDLIKIVQILNYSGVNNLGLTTNGSRITPNYIQKLLNAGISDIHIHLPSLDYEIFRKTTQDKREKVVDRIRETALYLKEKNQRIEFNTPVTSINLRAIPQLINFCYANKINLKLIEEVNLVGKQINEKQITKLLKTWFENNRLSLDKTKVDKKYGHVYNLGDFYFRIAPVTKGLVNFLNGESETILYDGRYWIGGRKKEFMFTPSCFLNPKVGSFEDLERNLNETIQIYRDHEKE